MEGNENLNLLENFNKKKEEKENTGDFSKMQKSMYVFARSKFEATASHSVCRKAACRIDDKYPQITYTASKPTSCKSRKTSTEL